MTTGRLEFFVEPFTEGRPGPHVAAAIDAIQAQGLQVEVGPFNSLVEGDPGALIAAAEVMLRGALLAGAGRITLQLSIGDQPAKTPTLHDALARMIAQVEVALGAPLPDLPREQKQAAVRILDERGAFLLRRSIEEVADAMGVSRITIYNYLNAIRGGE
ncbi:MAG TPA: helix-turn-helix domain-containing protein [Acidimicrobiia bacterium]|nr:helix-turn-helix domain-containing protein [Acidimicrobiia bacterium]